MPPNLTRRFGREDWLWSEPRIFNGPGLLSQWQRAFNDRGTERVSHLGLAGEFYIQGAVTYQPNPAYFLLSNSGASTAGFQLVVAAQPWTYFTSNNLNSAGHVFGGVSSRSATIWFENTNTGPFVPTGITPAGGLYMGSLFHNGIVLDRTGADRVRLDGDLVENQTGAATATRNSHQVCDASGGDFTLTLPLGAADFIGRYVRVTNNGASGTVTVDGNGAETIDGVLTRVVLPGQSRTYRRISATAWVTAAKTGPELVVTPTKTSLYTARFGESVVVDPSAGDFNVNLPNIEAPDVGDTVEIVHDANSGKVTVDGDGADTIRVANASAATYDVKKWEVLRFRAMSLTQWRAV